MPFIIGIEGGYGHGKTLTSAVKAHLWANKTGAKIFSNYHLRGAYLFESYEDWYRVAHAHGSIIVFDESQKDWDSRRFSGSSQVDKTHIMNYVRKMNSVFVFVLPDFDDVDARVRKMCEILIQVERKRDGTIENRIYDYTDKRWGENGRLIKREYLTWEKQKEIFKLNLYDTHQMVLSFPMPPKNETQKFFERLDQIHRAAVKREFPNKQDIDIRIKDDLNLSDLFNPNHINEVTENANGEHSSGENTLQYSEKSKSRRKSSIRKYEHILV